MGCDGVWCGVMGCDEVPTSGNGATLEGRLDEVVGGILHRWHGEHEDGVVNLEAMEHPA